MRRLVTPLSAIFLAFLVTSCATGPSQQRPSSTANELPPGWGIFQGEATFPTIALPNNKKAFAPAPFPFQASGKLIWKTTDGAIKSLQVNQSGTCMVPGSSGLEGIKPCFQTSKNTHLILLDFVADQSSSVYRGRILEVSY